MLVSRRVLLIELHFKTLAKADVFYLGRNICQFYYISNSLHQLEPFLCALPFELSRMLVSLLEEPVNPSLDPDTLWYGWRSLCSYCIHTYMVCTSTGETTLGPRGIRTRDLPITTRTLYQMSYRPLDCKTAENFL